MQIPPPPGVPRPSSAWVGGETLCQPESLSTPPTSKIPATRSFHKPTICTPDASEFPQPAIIETAEKISKGRPATLRRGPFPFCRKTAKMPARIAQPDSAPCRETNPAATSNSITYRTSRFESETYLQSRPTPSKIRNLRNYASRIRNLPSARTQLPSESISSSIALWNQYFDPKSRNPQPNRINILRALIRNHEFTNSQEQSYDGPHQHDRRKTKSHGSVLGTVSP